MRLAILLIIAIVQVTSMTIPSINDLSSMIEFMRQVRNRLSQPILSYVRNYNDLLSQTAHLTCRIHDASSRLDLMKTSIYGDRPAIEQLGHRLNLGDNSLIWTIQYNVEQIEFLYMQYMNSWEILDVKNLRRLIPKSTESSSNYVPELLRDIHRIIAPSSSTDNFFQRLAKLPKALPYQHCDINVSLTIYKAYGVIVYNELLGFMMAVYAYSLKSAVRQKSYESKIDNLELETKSRLEEYIGAVKKAIAHTPSGLTNCAKEGSHISGLSYINLLEFYDGFVINQDGMDDDGSCNGQCRDISAAKKPCTGKVFECSGSGSDLQVLEKAASNSSNCIYCMCTCFADGSGSKKIKAFSHLWAVSDYRQNKVIIGIAISTNNGVMQLQAMQGKVLPGGAIDPDSKEWIATKDFVYNDKDNTFFVGTKKLEAEKDYGLINDNTKIIVDNIRVKHAGRAIVGVRFYTSNSFVTVQTTSMAFNLRSGKLAYQSGSLIDFVPTPSRHEFVIKNPGIPTNFVDNTFAAQRQYIHLKTYSGPRDEEYIIPFFDPQQVTIDFPLQTIGIVYRGVDDGHTGGFLALTVETINPKSTINTRK